MSRDVIITTGSYYTHTAAVPAFIFICEEIIKSLNKQRQFLSYFVCFKDRVEAVSKCAYHGVVLVKLMSLFYKTRVFMMVPSDAARSRAQVVPAATKLDIFQILHMI